MIKSRFTQPKIQINSMPLYKRALFLAISMLFIFTLWDFLLWDHLKVKKAKLTTQINTTTATVQQIEKQIELSMKAYQQYKQEKALEKQKRTQEMTHDALFIHPNELSRVLTQLLKKQDDLKLVALNVLPPQKLGSFRLNTDILEYSIEMTFQGQYFSTLHYLKTLEALHYPILWDTLDYQTTNHPNAAITLKIQTLSKGEKSEGEINA